MNERHGQGRDRRSRRWLGLGLILLLASAAANAETPIRRFVLAAGANNGGAERELLRYAVSDAEAFVRVFEEMGGLDPADRLLLRDPDLAAFRSGLAELQRRVESAVRWGGGRREAILYYSGHADEHGLLLAGERLPYMELRRLLAGIPAAVHIAVLDACASGSITRLKGGRRQQSFLVDESSEMQGYAFITSSSANEAAQESERLRASFFTHYLVSGLRGAADQSGDSRVSLDEAYRFAYDETLARTAGTRGGTQHPVRDIAMTGTGDLVMTDLRRTSAGLILGPALSGRFFVRSTDRRLAAEVAKPAGRVVELGLEPGQYRVHVEADSGVYTASAILKEGDHLELPAASLVAVATEPTSVRGGADPQVHLALSENPNLDIVTEEGYTLSLGLFFNEQDRPIRGLQAAWLVNQATATAGSQISLFGNLSQRELRGWQGSGMVNWSVGPLQGGQVSAAINIGQQVRGWQVAGSTNIAKRMWGWQVAGSTNIAKEIRGGQIGTFNAARKVTGVQVGVVNLSGDIEGIPLGIVNYSHTGLLNLGAWRDESGLSGITLASGSRTFFTAFSLGGRWDESGPEVLALGFGAGGHRLRGDWFGEADATVHLLVSDVDQPRQENWLVRARGTVGRRLTGHLSAFAGLSANLLSRGDDPALISPWGGSGIDLGHNLAAWPGVCLGVRLSR
ncbi:MAG: caspase family protein [Candidatus Latescibacterota bacterium]